MNRDDGRMGASLSELHNRSAIAASAHVETRIGIVSVEAGVRGLRRVVLPDVDIDALKNLPVDIQASFPQISGRTTLASMGIRAPILDEASIFKRSAAEPDDLLDAPSIGNTLRDEASPAQIVAAVSRDIRLFFEGELAPERLWLNFPLELPVGSDFSQKVMLTMTRIPPGGVCTYGTLAAMAGNVKAARAAGRVVGANPIPLIVPCHRVIGAGGSLTGYGGGLPLKVALLAIEESIISGDGTLC